MQILFSVMAFIVGACFGSFFCCQARRLHLKSTKKSSQKLPARSICLKCKTKLKWYDNIPIISWVILKGKCRKCDKKIGVGEIISEILTGLAFLLLSINLNLENPYFLIVFGVFILNLLFLAVYDGLYSELPTLNLWLAIVLAAILAIFNFSLPLLPDLIYSILILSGTYLALYFVSKGKWVGDGDWLLGLALGLALGSPWLALLTLFLSNLLACLVMLPKIKGKNTKIPFGPFLVVAFIVIVSFANFFNYVIMNLW